MTYLYIINIPQNARLVKGGRENRTDSASVRGDTTDGGDFVNKMLVSACLLCAVLFTLPVHAAPNAAEERIIAEYIAAKTEDAPYAVRLAMAAAILNRLSDERFPDTVSGILSAVGYSPARHTKAYESALSAVRTAAAGLDITDGAVLWAHADSADAMKMRVTFSVADWVFGGLE